MATMRNSQHPLISESVDLAASNGAHQNGAASNKSNHFNTSRRSKNYTSNSNVGKSLTNEDYTSALHGRNGGSSINHQNSSKLLKSLEGKPSGAGISQLTQYKTSDMIKDSTKKDDDKNESAPSSSSQLDTQNKSTGIKVRPLQTRSSLSKIISSNVTNNRDSNFRSSSTDHPNSSNQTTD